MIKAVFFDFYGTIVEEDDECITGICNNLSNLIEKRFNSQDIGKYWSKEFVNLCNQSYGDKFITQREIQVISLQNTLTQLNIESDAKKLCEPLWEFESNPKVFKESITILKDLNLPIYIISNIDNSEIYRAITHIRLNVDGVITSEDAKCYKPRREIFDLALKRYSLTPNEVIHIGDSFSSDIVGATTIGINAIWLNRKNRNIPNINIIPLGVCDNLGQILQYLT